MREALGDGRAPGEEWMRLHGPANRSLLTSIPELGVSSDTEKSRNLDSTELIQQVRALENERFRLQSLVCHLLHKNEQLRSQNLERNLHPTELSGP